MLITSPTTSSLYSALNFRRCRPITNILAYEVSTLRGQGHVHHDVFDDDGARHDRDLARYLSAASRRGEIALSVHDCFSDDELWSYLEALDLSVLPYRFGTHSGWLEACTTWARRCSPRIAVSTPSNANA